MLAIRLINVVTEFTMTKNRLGPVEIERHLLDNLGNFTQETGKDLSNLRYFQTQCCRHRNINKINYSLAANKTP